MHTSGIAVRADETLTSAATPLQRWLTQPQSVWLRKTLFQVHLWTGMGIGLYLVVVACTGSIIVFRVELSRGATPRAFAILSWLIDLHDNLLGGRSGRVVNGIGGLLLVLLCVTGAVVWWPGVKAWRRSLLLQRHVGWKRFNWNLHSVIGFWSVAFLLMWAVTGAYLVFQEALSPVIDAVFPYNEQFDRRPIDTVVTWMGRLHFGRYGGLPMKTAWAVLGLVPVALFVTGAIMWWHRVVRPRYDSPRASN